LVEAGLSSYLSYSPEAVQRLFDDARYLRLIESYLLIQQKIWGENYLGAAQKPTVTVPIVLPEGEVLLSSFFLTVTVSLVALCRVHRHEDNHSLEFRALGELFCFCEGESL
jgi:hypothetical protein